MNNYIHRPGIMPLFWESRGNEYDTIGSVSPYDLYPFFDADGWGSEVVFPLYKANGLMGDLPADRSYSDLVLCLDSGSAPVMQIHLKEEEAGAERNEAVFRAHIEELIEYIDEELCEDGDSEECQKLIKEAIEALNALPYDVNLTIDGNCDAADEIVLDLIDALMYQRLDEGDYYVVTLFPGEADGVPVEGEALSFRANEQDDLFEIDDPEEGQFYYDDYYGICFVYPECPYTVPDGFAFSGWQRTDRYYALDPGDDEIRFPCTADALWLRSYAVRSDPLPSCAVWENLPETAAEGEGLFLNITIDRAAWDAGYRLSSVLFTDEDGNVTEITRIFGSEGDETSDVTVFFLTVMPASDVTITPVFIEPTFDITWVIDGESETESWVWGTLPTHADSEKPATGQYSYRFAGWDPEIVPVTGDATYTAVFKDKENAYTVTWIVDGMRETETVPWGAVPSHPIPVKPSDPFFTYTFAGWSPAIVPVSGDAVYTAVFSPHPYPNSPFNPFSPNKPVPAIPEPKPESVPQPVLPAIPALPFTDVALTDSFWDDVKFVYDRDIMNGISDTLFDPFGTLTRGMAVTILHRLEGAPEVAYSGTFTDVPDGTWYTDGVEWAASKGIVNGYGDGQFGPTDEVTREQLAAILYKYAAFRGCEIQTAGFLPDGNISPWAVEYVNWAAANGVLRVSGGTVRATEKALRWEVAAAIRGFCENAVKYPS